METQETETVSKVDFYVVLGLLVAVVALYFTAPFVHDTANTVALTLAGWVRISVGFVINLF